MRPQTANDDVRLDAFDQLRRLSVRFCNQALSHESLSRCTRRVERAAYSHMTRILPFQIGDSIGVYLENKTIDKIVAKIETRSPPIRHASALLHRTHHRSIASALQTH
jgi:hypothetical protein